MPRVPNKSPDEALEADAAAVFDVMTELLRVYQFRDRDRVAPPGLTVTQTSALEIVFRRREVTAKELARELALEKSTVSRLVEAMAEGGWSSAWIIRATPAPSCSERPRSAAAPTKPLGGTSFARTRRYSRG
jgi:hypothetical protein